VHLVGFIIRIYHDARSPERQKGGEYIMNEKCIIKFEGRLLVASTFYKHNLYVYTMQQTNKCASIRNI